MNSLENQVREVFAIAALLLALVLIVRYFRSKKHAHQAMKQTLADDLQRSADRYENSGDLVAAQASRNAAANVLAAVSIDEATRIAANRRRAMEESKRQVNTSSPAPSGTVIGNESGIFAAHWSDNS